MRCVQFKEGVQLVRWTPSIEWILHCLALAQLTPWVPQLVITSINDGVHSFNPKSRHYSDEAVDVRSRNFNNKENKLMFVDLMKMLLNSPNALRQDAFTVLFEHEGTENEHFHIQVNKNETYP